MLIDLTVLYILPYYKRFFQAYVCYNYSRFKVDCFFPSGWYRPDQTMEQDRI